MKYEHIIELMAMAYNQGYKAAIEIMQESTRIAKFDDEKLKQDMMKTLQKKFESDISNDTKK